MTRPRRALITKRLFDLMVTGTAGVLLAPVWGLLALTVWIGMGRPVLFSQTRLGLEGRPFTLYKFRTMTMARDASGELLPDDQRLSRLGRFLRRTTMDELPELINVLRGDMSIVGPRPLLPEYRGLYSSEQWRRHQMRPGMAGPAVAIGRNSLTWEKKLDADVGYIDNWSLGMDIRILVKSIARVVSGSGVSAAGHATMPRFRGTPDPPAGGGDAFTQET